METFERDVCGVDGCERGQKQTVGDSTVPNSEQKFSLCLGDMENWDASIGAGAVDGRVDSNQTGRQE